jgi:hypothetical protein
MREGIPALVTGDIAAMSNPALIMLLRLSFNNEIVARILIETQDQ